MIERKTIDDVAASLARIPPGDDMTALAGNLRERFPGVRIVVCADDDIPPRIPPAFENASCRLYYLDTGEHCVRLTADADAAGGLVVGLIGDDD